MSSKGGSNINGPYVLEFVLPFLLFPKEILQMRLVSRKWNASTRKALGNQIVSYRSLIK